MKCVIYRFYCFVEVLLSERDQASKIFTRDDNKIAFGRRSDGPPLRGNGEQLQTTICGLLFSLLIHKLTFKHIRAMQHLIVFIHG